MGSLGSQGKACFFSLLVASGFTTFLLAHKNFSWALLQQCTGEEGVCSKVLKRDRVLARSRDVPVPNLSSPLVFDNQASPPLLSVEEEEPFRKVSVICPGLDLVNKTANLTLFRQKLARYARFHREQLQLMQSKDKPLLATDIHTLSWACPDSSICHGLGDQLYRIQLAFLLAMASNRVFLIQWDSVSVKTMRFLKSNAIRWDYGSKIFFKVAEEKQAIHPVNLTSFFPPNLLLEAVYNSSNTHLTFSNEICMPFSRCIQSIGGQDTRTANLFDRFGIPWNSTFSELRYLKSTLLHYLFKLDNKVIAKTNYIQKKQGLNIPYVGIHLRTGFLGNRYEETRPGGNKFSLKKVIRKKHLWQETLDCSVKLADVTGKDTPLFLATDSYLVKSLAREWYQDRIVSLNIDVQHPAMAKTMGNPMLNKTTAPPSPTRSVHKHKVGRRGPNTLDSGMGTWVDFLLLARSHSIVLPFSGFSILASNLCCISDANVYNTPKCSPS